MTVLERSSGAIIYRRRGSAVLFLILKKPNGDYDLPKGHIEKGESKEAAAKREVLEETGINPVFDPFFNEEILYFFRRGTKRISKHVSFFISEAKSGKVSISKEHIGYEWSDYSRAGNMLKKYATTAALLEKANEYIKRKIKMQRINNEYSSLPLSLRRWSLSRRLVPGEGRLDASIMIIGQAPGANEDLQGRPFVGRSGKVLDELLQGCGIKRGDVYITSCVQFFPPKNRAPSRAEIDACRAFLDRQMRLIKPSYVVLLGNLASKTLLGIGSVKKNHGRQVLIGDCTFLITLHPAAVLRFRKNYPIMKADFRKLCAAASKLRQAN